MSYVNEKFKIGDKIVCINDFYCDNELIYLSGRYYIVREIVNSMGYDMIKLDNYYFVTDNISKFYFNNYFQTLSDYRNSKIEYILED